MSIPGTSQVTACLQPSLPLDATSLCSPVHLCSCSRPRGCGGARPRFPLLYRWPRSSSDIAGTHPLVYRGRLDDLPLPEQGSAKSNEQGPSTVTSSCWLPSTKTSVFSHGGLAHPEAMDLQFSRRNHCSIPLEFGRGDHCWDWRIVTLRENVIGLGGGFILQQRRLSHDLMEMNNMRKDPFPLAERSIMSWHRFNEIGRRIGRELRFCFTQRKMGICDSLPG